MKIFKTICIMVAVICAGALLSACSGGSNNSGDRLVSVTVHADSKTVYYIGNAFNLNETYADINVNLQFGGPLTIEKYNLGMNQVGFTVIVKGFDSTEATEEQTVTIEIRGTKESEYRGTVSAQFKVTILEKLS